MGACLFSHETHTDLVVVPVGESRRDLHPQNAFVHGEVEVSAVMLHSNVVPVLVVQQAAQRHQMLAVRRSPAWITGRGQSEMKIKERMRRKLVS